MVKIDASLLDFWRKDTCVSLQPPVSDTTILEFERSHNVILPSDFRYYLSNLTNGFNQSANYQDGNGFNFLPLECLYAVSKFDTSDFKASNGRDYYVFCDYLDFCWAFAIDFNGSDTRGNIVVVGAGNPFPIVSKSFSEFIELYRADDARLYRF
ncbi:MAG: hypothetical protein RL748_872 [Pseudomonadota bacterium]|jgi:hypothetical protein